MKARVFSAYIKDVDKRYVESSNSNVHMNSTTLPALPPPSGARSSLSTPFVASMLARTVDGYTPSASPPPATSSPSQVTTVP